MSLTDFELITRILAEIVIILGGGIMVWRR